MKLLCSLEELNTAKSNDTLPCQCYFCDNTFYTYKKLINNELKNNRGRVRYCNRNCLANDISEKHSIELNCSCCNVTFKRIKGHMKKHKIYNDNYFCSRNCFNKFHGKNIKKVATPDKYKIINGISVPLSKNSDITKLRKALYKQIGYDEAKNCTNPFMFLFWGLYWGEGAKSDYAVHIANMDINIIKIFIKGMIEFYKVPIEDLNIKIAWHTHCDYTYEDIENYWLTNLGLEKHQVRKGTCKSIYYPDTKIKSHYGVCNIRKYSTEISHRIAGAIKFLTESQINPINIS